MLRLLVFCALGLSTTTAAADPRGRYLFRSYGSAQGLGNLAVHQIAQSADGLLWVATEDGLYSYDGARFHRLDSSHGLPSSQIFSLLASPHGLWVGTARGLALITNGRVLDRSSAGFPEDQVNALAVAPNGMLWAATDSGVVRQIGARFELAPGWPGGASAALWIGRDGRVVAGRGADLVATTDARTWRLLGESAGFARDRLEQIAQTSDGILWVRSARHLWSCDAALACRDRSSEVADVSEIGRLFVDRRGTLWVPTREGLDHRVAAGRWERVGSLDGLPARSVMNVFEDREGSLWVAADQLYQMLGRGLWQAYTAQGGFPGDTVWNISRTAAGTLLVGSNRGIHEASGGGWVTLPGTEPFNVQTIVQAGPVLYAAGTEARVMRFDVATRTLKLVGPDAAFGATAIASMVLDRGTLWVGTWNAGLLTMTVEGNREVWRQQTLPGGHAREDFDQLVIDRAGRLWAAGSEGLAVREGDTWRRITERDGLASRATSYLLARANGELCVAYTESFGVTCFRYDDKAPTQLRHLTRATGLTSDKVYLLGEDAAGRLYVGMGTGLDIVDGAHVEHVSTESGMAGDDCAARAFFADASGDVFVGTTRGMARFTSAQYTGPPALVAPVVNAITLGGMVSRGGETPHAPEPGTTSLTVDFGVPAFANRERMVQQVRLRPLEAEWRDVATSEVHYPQLSHGAYVFEVRTRLATGPFGPETSVAFSILPAWWQTTWFRLAVGLAGLVLVGGLIRWGARRSTARAAKRIVYRSERSLHALIEQSPDALIVHRDGVIVYVNARTVGLLGYASASELCGQPAIVLVHPTDRDVVLERRDAILQTGAPPPVREITFVRKDGTPVMVEAAALVVDFGGTPAILTIARDCSERKALEARLMMADRMASIGTLAAGIAHEVNNPLAYVKSNLALVAEQLAASPPQPVSREAIADALEGATRVEKIIRGLRTFSRVEQEARMPVDLHAALDLALRMTSNELRHRCQVVKDCGVIPHVLADDAQLGQVFINLLVNAAQAFGASPPDQNLIRIATSTDDRGRAVVEVGDNGSGIAPDVAKRIFEPFFTTKDVGQGTGLGLAICHGIVQALGGEITVDTAPGRGSTFRVVLPSTPTVEAPVPAPVAPPAPATSRLKILVVDDDERLRASIGRMLRAHDVTVAPSADAALAQLLAGAEFDVILCDLMMPGLTGMELHARLAAGRPAMVPRMLFMTGGAFTPAAQAFLDDPTIRWVEKPFDAAELRRQIQDAAAAGELAAAR